MTKKVATGEEMVHKIRSYWDHQSLYKIWQSNCETTSSNSFWKKGKALEYIILRAFEIEGTFVKYPFEVSVNNKIVEQIDGAIFADGLSVLCECKDYDWEKINIEPIAKLRSQLQRRPNGTIGCVFSMTDYTTSMTILMSFINGQTILLWDKDEIEYCLRYQCFTKALREKYRHAVEYANYYFKYNISKKYG